MRRISSNHDAASLISLRNQCLAGTPWTIANDADRNVLADGALNPTDDLIFVDVGAAAFGFTNIMNSSAPLSVIITPLLWESGLTAQYIQARRLLTNFG
ncbi:MAG: hypothetical protein WBQ55_10120 [Xanthobacteraceae bacterium]